MVSIRLSDDIEEQLEVLSNISKKNKSFLIKEAWEMSYLKLKTKYIGKNRKTISKTDNFYSILLSVFGKEPIELITEARKKEFKVFSQKGKLFILNSKNNVRALEEKPANDFFNMYLKEKYVNPSEYRDVTFNASYYLAIINYLSENHII